MKLGQVLCGAGLAAVAVMALTAPVEAKPARCFTTDDGYYPCNFRALDDLGSFRISAPGYPTFTLEIDQPGFAYAYINGRPLPGQYVRSRDDGACWNNPETGTKLCAW